MQNLSSMQDRQEESSPDTVEVEPNGDLVERRRSVRAKRDKPDYYDALDYESKRQKTPRSEKKKVGAPSSSSSSPRTQVPGKMRRFPVPAQVQSQGRATLTWKKGEEDDTAKKKTKKLNVMGRKEETEEVGEPVLEEIPAEKVFPCAVSLAEINRKLGIVMWKPVPTQ